MADPDLWFPSARLNQLAPVDGGSILGGKPKMLWHVTVTSGFPSYSTGFFPHFTVHPGTGEVRQHIPANRAARALRNETGGVQTNRWSVLQVEVIGFPDQADFHPVMADLALWARDRRGVPRTTTVDWHRPYNNGQAPSSFGNWPGRLSDAEWSSYTGHLAHMHCPENVHGDTGWPFPISQILAGEQPELPEEDMAYIIRADNRVPRLVSGQRYTPLEPAERDDHLAAGVPDYNYGGNSAAYDQLQALLDTKQDEKDRLVRALLLLATGQENLEFKTENRLVGLLQEAAGVAHLIAPPVPPEPAPTP